MFVLHYDYVDNIVERRAPYRDDHLALVAEWKVDGRFAMGGAVGDPPHGALIAFDVTDEETVREFVAADPYIEAGLVTDWRIERWHVV
jgi:uncharacterized protein